MPESSLDHLVYAVPDLTAAAGEFAAAAGVEPAYGGVHPEFGTHNALVSLGGGAYLELLAPHPEADGVSGLGELVAGGDAPRLVTFAVRVERAAAIAAAAGELGLGVQVAAGSRTTPGGELLAWRNVMVSGHGYGRLMPFFIEWAPGSAHPSATSPAGCTLAELRLTHPEPADLAALVGDFGVSVGVDSGPPGLVARLVTPRGELVLS